MSLTLLLLWVALARSTSPGQILIGLVLAFGVPPLTTGLRLKNVRLRAPLVLMRFVLTVAVDVVTSNAEIAWGIVAGRWRQPRPAFVTVPLELRDPAGLAALAVVTTIVPGTVWTELALDRSALLLHVWDVGDESAFVARFKHRYERPLREIFE
nr:Na+/H+ antiporter subunit E [Panacagrimonas perspica]